MIKNTASMADITNKGIRTFVNPVVGLDIARFSLKVGYEYQLAYGDILTESICII